MAIRHRVAGRGELSAFDKLKLITLIYAIPGKRDQSHAWLIDTCLWHDTANAFASSIFPDVEGQRTKDDPGHQSIFCSNLSNYSAAIQFKLLPSFAAARPQIAYFTLDVFTVVLWQEWASQLLNAYTRTKNILHSFSILGNI